MIGKQINPEDRAPEFRIDMGGVEGRLGLLVISFPLGFATGRVSARFRQRRKSFNTRDG